MKEIQKAHNEHMVLSLAEALLEYDIYFPAFQDFRGRIYRTGTLNLHERDLYRSLIRFKPISVSSPSKGEIDYLKISAALRYQSSFLTDEAAMSWFDKWLVDKGNRDTAEYIIESMSSAKEPFQFMRKALLFFEKRTRGDFYGEPVSMDASSSAYQIMSYLLLDAEMARLTNLIKSYSRNDLYSIIRERLLEYLKQQQSGSINEIIANHPSRKLVKALFMPITYGKTIKSMSTDCYQHMGKYMSYKDCIILAQKCHNLWCHSFPGINNLLKL